MFTSLPSPVLIAHRGASAHAPENTLAAFNLAVSQGAPAIELDVQLTADDSVVVFHDRTLSRTTDGYGKIRQHSLSQLKKLHAGAAFGSAYPIARIPTLEEVFNDLDPDVYLNIELKNINSPFDTLPERTANLISKYHAEKRVLISSFNPIALARMAHLCPMIPRGILLHKPSWVDFYLSVPRLLMRYQTINISFSCVTKFRVNSLHKKGKKVFVYTLNHPEDIQFALGCGVDGFFTDDPALGLRTLSGSGYNYE